MNLRDFTYFIAVAELGNFTRAAERCNVSQPTLSMQLKKLEEELNIQLFERHTRAAELSEAGKQILPHAYAMLRQVDAIKEQAIIANDPFSGRLRIGAFPTLAPYYFPSLVDVMQQSLPNIQLELVEEKTQALTEALQHGKLDAALIALPVADDELTALPLFDDSFMLAVPNGHDLATREQVHAGDLTGYSLMLLEDGHCLRDQALEVCTMVGAPEARTYRATSMETLRQMVRLKNGITLIPRMACREDNAITYVPFASPAPYRRIALVYRKRSARHELFNHLAELLTTSAN